MVLIDTSVWVAHLRNGGIGLEKLLNDADAACHPFVAGELACGNLANRTEILSLLQALPVAIQSEHDEVMRFIENYSLMGKGLGYVDVHLLASAKLSEMPLWTLDKRLHEAAAAIGVSFSSK